MLMIVMRMLTMVMLSLEGQCNIVSLADVDGVCLYKDYQLDLDILI